MQIQTNSVASAQAISLLGDNKPRLTSASVADAPVKNSQPASPSITDQSADGQDDVQSAVDQINEAIQSMASNGLEFSIDKDTDMVVVKVIDQQTEEVIRQIPSEEVLQIAQAMEKLKGLLVRDKA